MTDFLKQLGIVIGTVLLWVVIGCLVVTFLSGGCTAVMNMGS